MDETAVLHPGDEELSRLREYLNSEIILHIMVASLHYRASLRMKLHSHIMVARFVLVTKNRITKVRIHLLSEG